MDETQIAEELRKNIPKPPPPSDGSTDEPPKPEQANNRRKRIAWKLNSKE